MGQKPQREDLLAIVVNGGDETKIVGDVENRDRPTASNRDLVGMREGLTGLGEILPLGGAGHAMPVIQGCPGLGIPEHAEAADLRVSGEAFDAVARASRQEMRITFMAVAA